MKNRINHFKKQDPFNPSNIVEGIIYLDEKRYGDIEITKVNDLECPQYIHTTPKFKYPHEVNSPSVFEKNIKRFSQKIKPYDKILIYEKVDGTNIFLYGYYDTNDVHYRTFKTRMQPFLNSKSAMGDWVVKWKKCLKTYDFSSLMNFKNFNFGFEFFSDVIHLISSKRLYECDFLYGIDLNGNIQLPSQFDTDIPIPKLLEETTSKDFEKLYLKYISYTRKYIKNIPTLKSRKEYDEKHKEIQIEKEGTMFYGILNNQVNFVYKCKPIEIVECQSMDSTNEISIMDIRTTAINTLEDLNSLDQLKERTLFLLKESFTLPEIDKSRFNIEKTISKIINEFLFKEDLLKWFHSLDPEIKKSKKEVMLLASSHEIYKKNTGKIFYLLKDYFQKII